MTFLRRMVPEEVDAAIEEGLLTEEDLVKDARVAYRVWLKEHKNGNQMPKKVEED